MMFYECQLHQKMQYRVLSWWHIEGCVGWRVVRSCLYTLTCEYIFLLKHCSFDAISRRMGAIKA